MALNSSGHWPAGWLTGWLLAGCWVRPALRQYLCKDLVIFLLPGQCKAGRASFGGPQKKSATCFAQCGSHFPQSGQVLGSLPRVLVSLASFLRASATGFAQCGSRLGILRPKKGATWVAAPRVKKSRIFESSQNGILYSGKCSHIPWHHFKAI